MGAVLPHYSKGVASRQVAALIFGGQWVMPNSQVYGDPDLTVNVATTALAKYTLGVAGTDGNVMVTQTGAPNTYGEPAIDISVLPDYVPVYQWGVDIWCWYGPSVNVYEGQLLTIVSNYGTVGPWSEQGASYAQAAGDAALVVGRCTHPGGVAAAMCVNQIGGGYGGGGGATYFLGRARVGF